MNTMSLWDLRKALAQIAADDPSQPPHARAFALWIRREKMELAAPLRQLAEELGAGRRRRAPDDTCRSSRLLCASRIHVHGSLFTELSLAT